MARTGAKIIAIKADFGIDNAGEFCPAVAEIEEELALNPVDTAVV